MAEQEPQEQMLFDMELPVAPKDMNKDQMSDLIQEIFVDWQTVMEYPTRRPTKKRKGIIHARLLEGFSKQDFHEVIRWAAVIPFYRGFNDRSTPYDDFHNLFGNTEKFERNLTKARANLGLTHSPKLAQSPAERKTRTL